MRSLDFVENPGVRVPRVERGAQHGALNTLSFVVGEFSTFARDDGARGGLDGGFGHHVWGPCREVKSPLLALETL